MKIHRLLLPSFLAMTLLLSACAKQTQPFQYHSKVGTWKTAQTIQPFFYDQYLPEGDTVEVLPFTNPGDQKTALLAGDLDLCGTTWVTAIIAASKGEPILVVGSMTEKASALVIGSGSGITDASDLKDKTIAYVPGTMHHILLLEILNRAGLDSEKDVTLQRIDFFDMGQALATQQIDAFLSGEPYPSIAVTQGYGKILEYPYYDDSVGFINAAIITTKDKLAREEDKIRRLVKAHSDSTRFLNEHRTEWLAKAAEFGVEPAVLDQAANNIQLASDLTPDMISQVKNLASRMQELGLIETVPDIDALIAPGYIKN